MAVLMRRAAARGAVLAVAAILAGGVPVAGLAQASNNRVAVQTDWSVFEGTDPKECWSVSAPKETVNTRDGAPVQVRRGDILMFVTYRVGAPGEMSFAGGYPFATGSNVQLTVGEATFELFTEGEFAWSGTPEDDVRIIEAMKAGSQAVLTGRSDRGTQTRDTFSLLGFTAAVEDAARRCAG